MTLQALMRRGLGNLRVEKTKEVTQKTDMAILVFRDMDISWEMTWYEVKEKQIPVLCIWNQDAEDEKAYADVVTADKENR